MQINLIPVLSTNYIFFLYDAKQNIAAVVDPAEAQPVLQCLENLGAKLVAIFNTHHHQDHVGGNQKLRQYFPDVCVYAGAKDVGRIPGQQVFLEEGDRVEFAGRVGQVLFVPGHTFAHIAYYFPPSYLEDTGELFCGDTLFSGGCGRLFEGTPRQMVNSLSKLRDLPDNTRVWCAHEYTLNNLQFALTVDRDNEDLQKRYHQVQGIRNQQQATIPSLLAIEKQTNPFLRWDVAAIQTAMSSADNIETFATLRKMKDNF